MKLFKILSTHYAPKDYHTAIDEFVVARNDMDVFLYLANGKAYWIDLFKDAKYYSEQGDMETAEELFEEFKDIYNNRGDEREVYDLYYGATQYSWERVEVSDNTILQLMVDNKLAKKIDEYDSIEL